MEVVLDSVLPTCDLNDFSADERLSSSWSMKRIEVQAVSRTRQSALWLGVLKTCLTILKFDAS